MLFFHIKYFYPCKSRNVLKQIYLPLRKWKQNWKMIFRSHLNAILVNYMIYVNMLNMWWRHQFLIKLSKKFCCHFVYFNTRVLHTKFHTKSIIPSKVIEGGWIHSPPLVLRRPKKLRSNRVKVSNLSLISFFNQEILVILLSKIVQTMPNRASKTTKLRNISIFRAISFLSTGSK